MRAWVPSAFSMSMPVESTPTTLVPSSTSTPILVEAVLGCATESVAERWQDLGRRVQQHDPRLTRVDRPEVPLEGAVRELGDLTGHLDARGPGTDDDEGEIAVALGRGSGELGPLEGTEDAATQFEGVIDALHAGGVLSELVVAEVGLPGTCCDEQGVERRHGLAAENLAGHGLGRRGRSR